MVNPDLRPKLSRIVWVLGLSFTCFGFSPAKVNAQVVINEFSSNTSTDWVELYSSEDVDISNWTLQDSTSEMGNVTAGTVIGPNSDSFFVVSVSNRLNKDGDEISLFDATGVLKDKITYGDKGGPCLPSDAGSIGRYPDANATIDRFATATKGATNTSASLDPCPTPTPEPTANPTVTPTPSSTKTPTPTPVPTKKPTSKPTATPQTTKDSLASAAVLAATLSPTPTPAQDGTEVNGGGWLPLAFVGGGLTLAIVGGVLFLKVRKSDYTGNDDKGS